MNCSNCGAAVDSAARFCTGCGNPVAGPDSGMRNPSSPPPPPQNFQNQPNNPLPNFQNQPNYQNHGNNQQPGRQYAQGKTGAVALIMSFFIPGLGQLYNGDLKKGAAIFFGAIIIGALSAGIGVVAFWIWGMIDGYQVAEQKTPLWN